MKWPQILLGLLFVGESIALPQQPVSSCTGTNCFAAQALEPRFFKEYNPQRQAIAYGPFTVPGSGENHGMKSFSILIPPPCSDCFITHAQADLQYPNGTYANVNTGMWLHHVVISNLNRTGAVCPMYADYVFASGNERTPANICVNGTQKAGYFIAPKSLFHLGTELMNDQDQARDAMVVIDWEYVPLSTSTTSASDFKHATPLWLDIDGACSIRGSKVPVPDNGTVETFSLSMTPPWKSTFSADTVLWVMSHLHDGGDDLLVTRNGELVCDSVAKYGETDGYISTSVHQDGGRAVAVTVTGRRGVQLQQQQQQQQEKEKENEKRAPAHTTKTPHVSSISSCALVGSNSSQKVQVGDEWSVKANYNPTKYKPTSEGTSLAPIMGISMVYLIKN